MLWLDGQIEEQFVTHRAKKQKRSLRKKKDIALMAGIHQKNWMRDSVMLENEFLYLKI